MRRFQCALLATVAVVAFASGASAADMPVKAPVKAPLYNWSGFYIGGNAGYGWARDERRDYGGPLAYWTPFPPAGGGTQTINPQGAVYGGHIGYNWQSANWVLGIEGQFNGTTLKRTDPSSFYPLQDSWSSKISALATVTGRVGYAFNDWLPYIKGGYAAARLQSRNFDIWNDVMDHTEWHSGWVVGAGLEYAFAGNWIVGVEYDFMNFGGKNWSGNTIGPVTGVLPENFRDDLRISTVSGRLSYKFGGR